MKKTTRGQCAPVGYLFSHRFRKSGRWDDDPGRHGPKDDRIFQEMTKEATRKPEKRSFSATFQKIWIFGRSD